MRAYHSFPTSLLACIACLYIFVTHAAEVELTSTYKQQCAGMYSRKAWGGSVDPFILTKLARPDAKSGKNDTVVSVVVFEWADEKLIGIPASPESGVIQYICDPQAISDKHCADSELGQFILSPSSNFSKNPIITEALHLENTTSIRYPVKKTGYYCVSTFAYSDDKYQGIVEFRNAFGELPAAQIAKLPFYGALVLVYALMAGAWAFLYYQHRSDILPVQNYITAILVFLVVEIFMTWLFYDFQNRHGMNGGAKTLMVVVSILSAGRNSFSFFLLLIVCMGYGVVKPSLGKTMWFVRALAIIHFIFGIAFVISSLTITPENAGPLVLLVVLPLAATLTTFYIWTLNSLNFTLKDLIARKQTAKAAMYRKLWWCILISILTVTAFFFVNSWTFADVGDVDFVPEHWSTRWFILDGWLNLIYLADVAYVSWVWRPTANNRRFAMSDEIAQDDEGFEIASMRDSLDGEELDPETGLASPMSPVKLGHGGVTAVGNAGGSASSSVPPPPYVRDNGATSPLPAPVPQKHSSLATAGGSRHVVGRESLDGETIFAVGGDDEEGEAFLDSDDDTSDDKKKGIASRTSPDAGESSGLTGGGKKA